jgi:hypothetical protein
MPYMKKNIDFFLFYYISRSIITQLRKHILKIIIYVKFCFLLRMVDAMSFYEYELLILRQRLHPSTTAGYSYEEILRFDIYIHYYRFCLKKRRCFKKKFSNMNERSWTFKDKRCSRYRIYSIETSIYEIF